MIHLSSPLLALHMPDGLIQGGWLGIGWLIAAGLVWIGSRHLADSDIPRIALLCAVFFVSSLVPFQIPGGPRTHLLLNGLLGILLGRKSVLALAPALFLQAVLFGHGGFLTLGLNLCVMTIPAMLAGWLLSTLLRLFPQQKKWPLFFLGFTFHLVSLLFLAGVILMLIQSFQGKDYLTEPSQWFRQLAGPKWLVPILLTSVLLAFVTTQKSSGRIFSLGFFVGEFTVLFSLLLNCLVMILGGLPDLASILLISLLIHIPLAIVEGLIMGSILNFLHSVRPGMVPAFHHQPTGTTSTTDTVPPI